jgi:hypothetical protein
MMNDPQFLFWLLGGIVYISGCLIYIFRFPEKFSGFLKNSEKIFGFRKKSAGSQRYAPRFFFHITLYETISVCLLMCYAGPVALGESRWHSHSASGTCRNGIYPVYTWYIPCIDQHWRYRRYIPGIYQVYTW